MDGPFGHPRLVLILDLSRDRLHPALVPFAKFPDVFAHSLELHPGCVAEIVDILIELSELPFKPFNAPFDAFESHLNVSKPSLNAFESHLNVSEPSLNAFESHLNVSEPLLNATEPPLDVSEPLLNVSQSCVHGVVAVRHRSILLRREFLRTPRQLRIGRKP